MNVIPVSLAVEDALSESVLRAILNGLDRGFVVGTVYSRGGFGYLRKSAPWFNQAARGTPYVLLTDLDNAQCAPALMDLWLDARKKHPNFIFRVAVREVEAWLLADRDNPADFLRVSSKRFPAEAVELLADPKKTLVKIASLSRSSDIKSRIVPKRGSTAHQGPDYNACLDEFVRTRWDFRLAARECRSLHRTINRLSTFEPTWG